jgi:hypothetical protein
MNPEETDNKMKAIEAPIFTNLEIARQWVNEQSLDEPFYLVEFHASKAYIEAGRQYRGDTPTNLYEFFNHTEYNDMIDNQVKLIEQNALRRQVRLIEQWS